jgi:hypothetical protein
MTPDFLKYVRHLSEQDRKTLSQKALKTCEEVGELAKVVLPFDNAYATTHRFTERESILEEAVDTVLCALSVAYDLKFTDEEIDEMLIRKAEKWALLQSKEVNVKYPLPYEIHITVCLDNFSSAIAHFNTVCKHLDVKPIVLNLQTKQGDIAMVDVMTSSKHFGDNRSAYLNAITIKRGLIDAGYEVARVKIETVPWHPAAPVGDQPMPPSCYFEAHIPITLAETQLISLRANIADWRQDDIHLSRNTFKCSADGIIVQMLTLRHNRGTYETFKTRLDTVINSLSSDWVIGKVITEFSIYDTKISHDASWIKG